MNDMKQQLLNAVKSAKDNLDSAEKALFEFESKAENNVYDSYDEACEKTETKLYSLAREACEDSYCFGDEEYEQEFIINGMLYLGTLTVEYNRYDKQYYYIENAKFDVKVIYT